MLKPRVSLLPPRAAYVGAGKPWDKGPLSPNRMGASKRQARNRRIKDRDRWTCRNCGVTTGLLEVDHILPLSQGGTEDDSNLQSLCIECHDAKTKAEAADRARFLGFR